MSDPGGKSGKIAYTSGRKNSVKIDGPAEPTIMEIDAFFRHVMP